MKSPSAGRKRASESKEAGQDKKLKVEALNPAEYDAVMGGENEAEV